MLVRPFDIQSRNGTPEGRRGLDKHMLEELEQADLADCIRNYCRERKGKLVRIGELTKASERKIGEVRKLKEVIWHVESTGDIVQVDRRYRRL